jgi:hypothetical protein
MTTRIQYVIYSSLLGLPQSIHYSRKDLLDSLRYRAKNDFSVKDYVVHEETIITRKVHLVSRSPALAWLGLELDTLLHRFGTRRINK